MTPQQLWIASLCLGSLGTVMWACTMVWKLQRSQQASSQVEKLLQARERAATSPHAAHALFGSATADAELLNPPTGTTVRSVSPQALAASLQPPAWLQTGWARVLLAEEDRKLLDQAGIALRSGSVFYVTSRLLLALAFPLLVLAVLRPNDTYAVFYGFLGLSLGLMLPKWLVRAKARQRREQVVEELPLFVDLLRLLQGVGLSIDQSLQILASEFGSVLRVISGELALANQLYSSGRTREQSFQRLANLSADDDMSAVVNLLTQVDRHGGAVQEPLKEFSIRLREKRQARFKEKIGAITVKMTGVMVLTLLPALLVITAGPGFLAVIRALSSIGGA
ncbi:MAG: type II secretion system F family protein [Delftia acidovorans]|uniref:Type II secretion system F family protein n=1 Tax=Delftia acidovorans TaxID=80866 RepID=A0A7T2W343_DELAC|nr:type II secretion system F family protein [Delftia acidovorans]MBL8354005.1 type II secretion system F family protein [Delftia acidovorans]QPS10820.1 type II secretion system F family protein [Delftia acidovorans]